MVCGYISCFTVPLCFNSPEMYSRTKLIMGSFFLSFLNSNIVFCYDGRFSVLDTGTFSQKIGQVKMRQTYKMQTELSLVNPERSTRPFDITLASADFLNTRNKWSLSPLISPNQDRRNLNLQGQYMQNKNVLSQRHCRRIILTIYSD